MSKKDGILIADEMLEALTEVFSLPEESTKTEQSIMLTTLEQLKSKDLTKSNLRLILEGVSHQTPDKNLDVSALQTQIINECAEAHAFEYRINNS